ncbi:MAG TPA: serine hydrolase [Verrucomicrobiae bacterium]|nr:serine hydrolase [Verrucomicrobiae bacterium]
MSLKIIVCLSLAAAMVISALAADSPPSTLPRSTPEAQGISSTAIQAFVEAADQKIDALHSFILVRHGHVVAEGWWSPYAAQIPHTMFSLSKSFTSTAVGLAISEGKLSLDDQIVKFFPDDVPAQPSDSLKAMRVRDLLIMCSGQLSNSISQFSFLTNEVLTKEFLEMPVEHKPGTFFFYNSPGSYMLSAIVQKVTGQTELDYLKPRLFDPLGIENPSWATSAQGICLGGYGLSIRTEDIAKFGLLYLNKGNWHGKQLVPATWVAVATMRQTSNGSDPNSDWEQGYGYQFWRARHNIYRGDGAFGQFCIVMPDQDAVVAITSGTKDLAGVMNLVWDKLLPAMQNKSLPRDEENFDKLKDALAHLTMHLPSGSASPGGAAPMSGRKYVFPANDLKIESAALTFGQKGNAATLALQINGVEQKIECGGGSWATGRMTFAQDIVEKPEEQPVAAAGAWTEDGVYKAKLIFYQTPFYVTFTLKFSGDQLIFDTEYNAVRRGAAHQPQLIGQVQ